MRSALLNRNLFDQDVGHSFSAAPPGGFLHKSKPWKHELAALSVSESKKLRKIAHFNSDL